jgi:hypothetical protein
VVEIQIATNEVLQIRIATDGVDEFIFLPDGSLIGLDSSIQQHLPLFCHIGIDVC